MCTKRVVCVRPYRCLFTEKRRRILGCFARICDNGTLRAVKMGVPFKHQNYFQYNHILYFILL